jgi:hypothetical protein
MFFDNPDRDINPVWDGELSYDPPGKFQMGHDLGLGGCWLAGYYLVYSKIIIYVPMYSTCLPMYLHAYLPTMYNSLLY